MKLAELVLIVLIVCAATFLVWQLHRLPQFIR
jgi:hypothetical protein